MCPSSSVLFTIYFVSPQNDIALIHLGESVEFTSQVRPVCLPSKQTGKVEAGQRVVASGWGRPTDTAKGISPVLREVNLETIDNIECLKQYPTVVNPNIVCISGEAGKSTCKGDSGETLRRTSREYYLHMISSDVSECHCCVPTYHYVCSY